MKPSKEKMYVIRKYVMAKSVSAALRKEPKVSPHEIFVDENWSKTNLADAIGFVSPPPPDEDD